MVQEGVLLNIKKERGTACYPSSLKALRKPHYTNEQTADPRRNQRRPVKMILLNNNFLGNVRQWQAMFFNRRYSFTPMMNPDYLKIASAYGIPARRALTRKELAEAIEEMISTDGPFLLEACVEEEGNVMPMTPPGGSVNQMLLEC